MGTKKTELRVLRYLFRNGKTRPKEILDIGDYELKILYNLHDRGLVKKEVKSNNNVFYSIDETAANSWTQENHVVTYREFLFKNFYNKEQSGDKFDN